MIGIIATMRVQDGKTAEFEQIVRDLAAQVKANEPGVVLYELTKSRQEATLYRFMELYADDAAIQHHGGTSYFKELFGKLRLLLAKDPEVELLDVVR